MLPRQCGVRAVAYLAICTSTRRFFCLSAALFSGETSGFADPAPLGVQGIFIPFAFSAPQTVWARAIDNFWFPSAVPSASVWTSAVTCRLGIADSVLE